MLNAKARLESGEQWDAPTPATSDNVPALLAQLATLRQYGVLTDEEFQQKKVQLLAKI
jgi:DNA-binding IclR family transcriptional regulator